MAKERFYTLMRLRLWKDESTQFGLKLAVRMPDGSVGYLPVYDTPEAVHTAYPDADILVIDAEDVGSHVARQDVDK